MGPIHDLRPWLNDRDGSLHTRNLRLTCPNKNSKQLARALRQRKLKLARQACRENIVHAAVQSMIGASSGDHCRRIRLKYQRNPPT
uniref:Uncharacterized protein n=1 Tax=Arundo donax TaxID=35708 RepID=A0A0A9CIH2_ARUDO